MVLNYKLRTASPNRIPAAPVTAAPGFFFSLPPTFSFEIDLLFYIKEQKKGCD